MTESPLALEKTLCLVGLGSKEGEPFAPHRMGKELVHFLASQTRLRQFPVAFGPFTAAPNLHAELAEGKIGAASILLVLPTTTMNSVGDCLTALQEQGLRPENLILAHDDCSIAPGVFRIVAGRASSAAGHHGVMAVETALRSTVFAARFKIGVGPIRGGPDAFFTSRHQNAPQIMDGFKTALISLLSIPAIRERCKTSGLVEIAKKWNNFLENVGQAELKQRIDRYQKSGQPLGVSPHPVFVPRSIIEQGQALWKFLLLLIRDIDRRYSAAIQEGELDHPLVQLLERGLPKALVPAVRGSALQVAHLRFDAHLVDSGGKAQLKVIELNAAAGGLADQQTTDKIFQGLHPFDDLQAVSCPIAELLFRYGVEPLLARADGKPAHVALVGWDGTREIGKNGNPLVARLIRAAGAEVSERVNCANLTFDAQHGLRARNPDGSNAPASRIDVLYALTTYAVQERAHGIITPAVSEAIAQGMVRLFPSPRNFLYSSKGFLAALSNPEERATLGVAEPQWERKSQHFPWCRVWSKECWGTAEAMRRAGLTVVKKPFFGSGGRGVQILGPLAQNHAIERYDQEDLTMVGQLYVPPAVLSVASQLVHDLLFSLYADPGANGKILAMPVHARVFAGGKANVTTPEGGTAAVFLYDD